MKGHKVSTLFTNGVLQPPDFFFFFFKQFSVSVLHFKFYLQRPRVEVEVHSIWISLVFLDVNFFGFLSAERGHCFFKRTTTRLVVCVKLYSFLAYDNFPMMYTVITRVYFYLFLFGVYNLSGEKKSEKLQCDVDFYFLREKKYQEITFLFAFSFFLLAVKSLV